jgi:hypothetical protein
VGIGWNDVNRQAFLQSDNNFADCNFTMHLRFEEILSKFPRYFKDPTNNWQANQYVDLGILHRNDVLYPPTEVSCSFDYLNYNFFCEQYTKV